MDKPILDCNPNNPRPKVDRPDLLKLVSDICSIWANVFRIISLGQSARHTTNLAAEWDFNSRCFSISTVGRPLSLGTGISGQFPKSLTRFWGVGLESLRCWRKDESDIRGTVLSVRTSAFLQVFSCPSRIINMRKSFFLSCTISPGSRRSSSSNEKKASDVLRKPAIFVLKKVIPRPLVVVARSFFLDFCSS